MILRRAGFVERDAPGGQAGQSARIENYLGFPNGLSGSDLSHRATTQARRLGAEMVLARTVVVAPREHALDLGVAGGLEPHGAVERLGAPVHRSGDGIDAETSGRPHRREEALVERAREPGLPQVGPHADEVDVRDIRLGLRPEADEEPGELAARILHDRRRVGEVLEEQARQQHPEVRGAGHQRSSVRIA